MTLTNSKPNKRLHRTNFRCHLLCKNLHKSRHQKIARWLDVGEFRPHSYQITKSAHQMLPTAIDFVAQHATIDK
jgi:hypothetical protein